MKFIKELNITGGLVMNQTFSHANLYNNGISPDNHVQNYAAYAQLDKKMWKVLNITVGFREEYYKLNSEREITKPIFRSGLNLKLTQATWLRCSYGQGFRFPTITEKFIKTRTGGLDVFPDPQLQAI